ncbi:BQ2448_3886 [Microbotryum intermedium]|uniref:BQ2448_3886 protein n=1 Tax=Microbotryum intermedium TaxID=269621 RepID=A0A238FHT1_9BASI|nr:BQ2448_3886 [Microbotryum intermedium]
MGKAFNAYLYTYNIHTSPTTRKYAGDHSHVESKAHDGASAHLPPFGTLCTQITATIATYFSPTTALPVNPASWWSCIACVITTIDSAHPFRECIAVRKAHNSGRNHLTNVRDYYACKYRPTPLGSDKAQDMIDQIARKYEGGAGGVARVLPMGPGMTGNMNGPPQMRNFGAPPPGFQPGGPPLRFGNGPPPGYGAPPPPMRAPGGYPNQGPPQGFQGGYQVGPTPPQHSGPRSAGVNPGFQPPPAMQPSPNFFPPTSGAAASAAPTTFGAPPLPTPGGGTSGSGGAPLVKCVQDHTFPIEAWPTDPLFASLVHSGLNPERARMLGLL